MKRYSERDAVVRYLFREEISLGLGLEGTDILEESLEKRGEPEGKNAAECGEWEEGCCVHCGI